MRRRTTIDVRGAVAAFASAVGADGLAYYAIGDQSLDRSVPGETRFVGPVNVSTGILLIGLTCSIAIGIAGALLLVRWIHNGRVRGGWAAIAVGGWGAAVVSAWTWRVLTATYVITGSAQIWLAVCAAAVAWAVVLVGAVSYLRSIRNAPASLRGCGYCAQEANMRHGDVHPVSADEAGRTLLLQCPRCGWLYVAAVARPELGEPIAEAEARELFPSTW